MSKKYTIAIIIILPLIILGFGIKYYFDLDWFVYPSTKELNIVLDDITIQGIDKYIRDSKWLKNKDVYLNEITVKATIHGEKICNNILELVYSNVFSEHDGEKKFKRYIYEIDLSNKMLTRISMNGNAQLSGYERNLALNDKYISFDDYIKMVINRNEVQTKYVNSGKEYNICLLFRHYDRPYKAIINNEYETKIIPIE